jgi:ElaB/YqjD/DUF883 family membrane-anchored ribosome-binding protein
MDQNRSRPEAQPPKEPKGASVGESLARGKDAIGAAASEAMTAAASDLQAIRNDLDNLKDTLARFMAQATDEAAKSAREVSGSVAAQMKDAVGDTVGHFAGGLADQGAQFAATAGERAKSFAGELEALARRNPLGALAGAAAIGFLIGVWGRRS